MKSLPLLPAVGGVDNFHEPHHAVFQLREEGGSLQPPLRMRAITDFDLASDGKLVVRAGEAAVTTLVDGRRLFSAGDQLLAQAGGSLFSSARWTWELASGLSGLLHAVEWPARGDQVFLSDGSRYLKLRAGSVYPWGLPVPTAAVVSTTAGTLPPGKYLVSCAYRDGTLDNPLAQESGASVPVVVEVGSNSGLALSASSASGATHVVFYVSSANQAAMFRAGVVSIGGQLTITKQEEVRASEVPLMTLGWGPPPAGVSALSAVQSFLLIASGKYLYRSWPGRPDLYHSARAVSVFSSNITTVVGLPTGAWVGTESGLYWLGGSPTEWSSVKKDDNKDGSAVLPEGVAVPGTAFAPVQKFLRNSNDMVAVFATRTGLVLGLPDGNLFRMTQDQYHFPTATRVSIAYLPGVLRQLLVAVT